MPALIFAAGETLTAAKLNASIGITVVKAAAQNNATTTYANDADLALAVEANSVYEVLCQLINSGGVTGDIKTTWTIPAGSTTSGRLCRGPVTGVSSLTSTPLTDISVAWTASQAYGNAASTAQGGIRETGILTTGANAGILQLQWAQSGVEAVATVVAANSFLRLKKIA